MKKLYAKHFAPNFLEDQSNEKIWEAIYNVADEEIWETRMALKYKLVDHIRKQFSESWLKNQGDPSRIVSLMEKINPNALLIGFAVVLLLTNVHTCCSPTWIVFLRS